MRDIVKYKCKQVTEKAMWYCPNIPKEFKGTTKSPFTKEKEKLNVK